jgi:hypothetical protein
MIELGRYRERERIIKLLLDYYQLKQEPGDDGLPEANEEWELGFQIAIALIRGGLQ